MKIIWPKAKGDEPGCPKCQTLLGVEGEGDVSWFFCPECGWTDEKENKS